MADNRNPLTKRTVPKDTHSSLNIHAAFRYLKTKLSQVVVSPRRTLRDERSLGLEGAASQLMFQGKGKSILEQLITKTSIKYAINFHASISEGSMDQNIDGTLIGTGGCERDSERSASGVIMTCLLKISFLKTG